VSGLTESNTILFGVTAPQSLKLLGNIPLKMKGAGWRVVVVGGSGSTAADPWNSVVEIVEIPMRRETSLLSDLNSLILWFSVIYRLKPKVVMIGTPKASFLGIISAKCLGVSNRIYFLRGLRLETLSGFNRKVAENTEKLTSYSATEIIAVSKSLSEVYSRLRLALGKPVQLLGLGSSHGVDLERFSPADTKTRHDLQRRLGFDPQYPVLGFIGRFSQDKGSKVLLELVRSLGAQGHKIQLLIVGEIEDSLKEFESLSRHCHRCVSAGSVKETTTLIQTMDMLLLPTRREGFPNVVLEAAACGVPSVTTNATGAVDSVVHMETGLIAQKESTADFVQQVEALLTDAKLAADLGKKARKRVARHFGQEQVEERYVDYLIRLAR